MERIDLVYSSDGGGWYAHEYDYENIRDRVSQGIYPDRKSLLRALNNETLEWEPWS